MPRLFTALPVPADIGLRLSLLSGGLLGARWADPDDYHVTLNFIGTVDGRSADEIASVMDQMIIEPFEMRIDGLGCFGSKKPRAIYARIEPAPAVMRLRASLDHRFRMMGLSPDARQFFPHIRLARLRDVGPEAVARWWNEQGRLTSRSFETTRFGLYSSRKAKGTARHRLEADYVMHAEQDWACQHEPDMPKDSWEDAWNEDWHDNGAPAF